MPVKNVCVQRRGIFLEHDMNKLSPADWQDIRTSINHSRDRDGAFCLDCNDPVLVRAVTSQHTSPHFAHFGGGGQFCPWGVDENRDPDKIRAGIYAGNQESIVHRRLCEDVLACACLDSRYKAFSGEVDQYFRPDAGGRGRWPDVYFEITGLGRFTVEVQLAPSLPTEVAARSKFYLSEKINLIWLVPRYCREMVRRAFTQDIAQEAGGNLFVFDQDAHASSQNRKTLMLWVLWNGGAGYQERLVSLDDLILREDRHPYFTDVVTKPIFDKAALRRAELLSHLARNEGETEILRHPITGYCDYNHDRLMRVLFSIWSAAEGKWTNYLNGQPNLTALLNPYLSSADGKVRAQIISDMLDRSRARTLVKPKVWEKVKLGLTSQQIGSEDPTVSEAMSLFPEVFREDLRGRPLRSEMMPDWAIPSRHLVS